MNPFEEHTTISLELRKLHRIKMFYNIFPTDFFFFWGGGRGSVNGQLVEYKTDTVDLH